MFQLASLEQSLDNTTSLRIPQVTSRVSPWLLSLVSLLGRYIVLPFYFRQIQVIGRENLPTANCPIILAPTHRSRWDALILAYAAGWDITGRYLRFMASAKEIKGLQGWFIKRLGGFPISGDRPNISSLRHGVALLQAKESLVIFPEGDIFRDGSVHPLKPGLARLALQAESSQTSLGIQIVPMSIAYSQAIPSLGCRITVKIGSPLLVENYSTGTIKQNAARLTADLEVTLNNLSASS